MVYKTEFIVVFVIYLFYNINYQTHLRSQGHANKVLKNSCTNSGIIKTRYKKR